LELVLPEVRATFEHVGRATVSHEVAAPSAVDACGTHPLLEQMAHGPGRESSTVDSGDLCEIRRKLISFYVTIE
jgi:hypothetical protein